MPSLAMKYVVVNGMAPRSPAVCAACSRPLERGYLHDLASSKRYCGIKCYHGRTMVNGLAGLVFPMNPFELAIALPGFTIDIASALFDSAWGNKRV